MGKQSGSNTVVSHSTSTPHEEAIFIIIKVDVKAVDYKFYCSKITCVIREAMRTW